MQWNGVEWSEVELHGGWALDLNHFMFAIHYQEPTLGSLFIHILNEPFILPRAANRG